MNDVNSILTVNTKDLRHSVSRIFEQPENPKEWKKYILTERQIAFFEKNGFLSGIKIMNDHQADKLSYALAVMQTKLHEADNASLYEYETDASKMKQRILFRAIGTWRVIPGFHDLLWSPAYRMATYQLLGQSFRLFQDQLICKPAIHGSDASWHQDFAYNKSTHPMQHLSCWIALSDANEKNGCIHYIPGSHTWGLLPITGATHNMNGVKEILNDRQLEDFENKAACILPRGYATFHHPLTLHGSYQNLSEIPNNYVMLNSMGYQALGSMHIYDQPEVLKDRPGGLQNRQSDTIFPLLFDADQEFFYMDAGIPKVNVKNLYTKHLLG